MIFVGGTGILPFLDLFDFLLKKSIYLAIKMKGSNLNNLISDSVRAKEVDFLGNNLDSVFSLGI